MESAASRNFAITVEALFGATHPSKHTRAVVAAVKHNALQSLRKLVELGADCMGVDATGKTILHHAAIHGLDLTLTLLSLYEKKLPAQTADQKGYYPIDYAIERSDSGLSRLVFESLFETDKVSDVQVTGSQAE